MPHIFSSVENLQVISSTVQFFILLSVLKELCTSLRSKLAKPIIVLILLFMSLM